MMSHITKIAALKNATAIWEYDPICNDNRVVGGFFDVIAAIITLAIKVSLQSFNVVSYLKILDSSIRAMH